MLTKGRISCRAVNKYRIIILLRIPQQKLPMPSNGPDNPTKLPLSVGISTSLKYGSLG